MLIRRASITSFYLPARCVAINLTHFCFPKMIQPRNKWLCIRMYFSLFFPPFLFPSLTFWLFYNWTSSVNKYKGSAATKYLLESCFLDIFGLYLFITKFRVIGILKGFEVNALARNNIFYLFFIYMYMWRAWVEMFLSWSDLSSRVCENVLDEMARIFKRKVVSQLIMRKG